MTHYEIADVFGSQPRIGGKYWWKRGQSSERELEQLFSQTTSKKVIVIDGPSGVGKTSLAYRTLYRVQARYNYVAINRFMTWKEFCKSIISVPKLRDETSTRKLGFSLRQLLPGGSIDTEHVRQFDSIRELAYSDQYLENVSIDTILDVMVRENVCLIVDDFEEASEELLPRVSQLARKLGNVIHNGAHSKIVILSCKRSFEKLLQCVDTLDGRIHHLTIGGLENAPQCWAFLAKGLELLSIKHPGDSTIEGEKAYLPSLASFTYDATGGILKSLTELGEELATKSIRNHSLKGTTAISIVKAYAQNNIDKYVRRFDENTRMLAENEHAAAVMRYIFQQGVNRCHIFADLQSKLTKSDPEVSAESGVSTLIAAGFLIPTGVNGSRFFTARPNYALAFCVARNRRTHYRVPPAIQIDSPQSTLPIVYEWDDDRLSSEQTDERGS